MILCLGVLAAGLAGGIQFYFWKARKQAQRQSEKMEALLEQSKIRYAEHAEKNREYHQLRHDTKKYAWMMQDISRQSKNLTQTQLVTHIFEEKAREANEKGISFSVQGDFTRQVRMEMLDLVRLLVNLLDNAVEACMCTNKPEIGVTIAEDSTKKQIRMEILNSKSREYILRENEDETGYISSKPDESLHGYGTRIIRQIVDENGGWIKYADQGDAMQVTCILKLEEE